MCVFFYSFLFTSPDFTIVFDERCVQDMRSHFACVNGSKIDVYDDRNKIGRGEQIFARGGKGHVGGGSGRFENK